MDLLIQIQQIVDAPIKDLLVQLHTALPDVDLSHLLTINGPDQVGDVDFGSSFGDANLGSSFGDANLGSSDFLNQTNGVKA